MPRPGILVVGSSNTDLIVRVEKHPTPGQTVLGAALITAPGGKGANQAVAAQRLGGRVTFLSAIGKDAHGEQALAGYRKEKINVSKIKRVAVSSGVALITVSKSGENMITVAGGANLELSPKDVFGLKNEMRLFRIALVQLETPLETVTALAGLCAKSDLDLILNPAPAQKLSRALLGKFAYLTPNETELEILSGKRIRNLGEAERSAKSLLCGRMKAVIVTLGSKGAMTVEKSGVRMYPAPKVKVLDTTAAGDCFNGALAVKLAEGAPLSVTVPFAIRAASISVTRFGAQPSLPRIGEMRR